METAHEDENLKENYNKVKLKYNLPSFEKLAQEFDIERIEKESSFALRDIRMKITEKILSYLHFFEILINPSSPPMFIFSVIKNLNENDRKKIKEIYKKTAKIQLQSMKLDVVYSEEKEAEFISRVISSWDEISKQVSEIFEKLEKDFTEEPDNGKRG